MYYNQLTGITSSELQSSLDLLDGLAVAFYYWKPKESFS